jgi:hypothetical protein
MPIQVKHTTAKIDGREGGPKYSYLPALRVTLPFFNTPVIYTLEQPFDSEEAAAALASGVLQALAAHIEGTLVQMGFEAWDEDKFEEVK